MSKINQLPLIPVDPIYGMQAIFKKDARSEKVNLSIGVCQDVDSKVLYFQAVKLAEEVIQKALPSKEYLPLTGHASYCQAVKELVCGQRDSILSVQTVGGTGALYIAARLLRNANMFTVFIPDPTWTNHKSLFSLAGHDVFTYPYYDKAKGTVYFNEMCNAIRKMPENSAIVLQASCHNPTGIDLTEREFITLSQLIKEKNLYPIFDLAYQGLGNSLEDDVRGISIFLDDGHEMMIATTFAKSFGLYNDRPGALFVKAPGVHHESILSHIQSIARSAYSSPPAHGAKIIDTILQDKRLRYLWEKELKEFRDSLVEKRKLLFEAMKEHNVKFSFDHLLKTKGLFCLFDLNESQVLSLRDEHALYLSLDGRICLCAITSENVQRVAKALATI